MPAVRIVEIPVTDLDRAVAFYAVLFGAQMTRETIDGHHAAVLDRAGSEGAEIVLMHGESYVPSIDGTRIYVGVADARATFAAALQLGAESLYDPAEVDGVIVAEIRDSEGNRIAILSDIS